MLDGHIEIDGGLLSNKYLNLNEKMVYIVIKYYADKYHDCLYADIQYDDIVNEIGLSRSTVNEAIKKLEKCKCILKKQRGLTLSNIYIIAYDEKMWKASSLDEMRSVGGTILKYIDDKYFEQKQIDSAQIERHKYKRGKRHKYKQGIGYIYVMKCMGVYKIGRCNINRTRLGEYTHLPEEPYYEVLEFVSDCYGLERFLHEKYVEKKTRDNCEWFNLTDNDLQEIKEIVKEYIIREEDDAQEA